MKTTEKLIMLKYWWLGKKDKLQMWFAWRLPKWLVEWATVRLVAHATTGVYSDTVVPDLTAMEALRRWGWAPTRHM
jgi:hypothetical protein